MADCIIQAAGIDWLTLSSVSRGTIQQMKQYYSSLVVESRHAGKEPVRCGGHGYVGTKIEHASLMDNGPRYLLQVSGERAAKSIMLCNEGDTPARIDIQVTVRIAQGAVPRWLDAAERIARQPRFSRGKRPQVKALHGADGNETVYIGSPKSALRLRLYDKFIESKEERYRDCVRLEAQLRHNYASRIWCEMATKALGSGFLLGVLYAYLNQANIPTDWISSPWSYVRPPAPLKKAVDAQEAWWQTQVAPGVARHVAEFGLYRSMELLYGKALTPQERSAMLDAAADAV